MSNRSTRNLMRSFPSSAPMWDVRVALREFDDVPFVGSLVVVVQNSKTQTLVVESKQLHHTPRLVRNQNQK